MTWPLPPGGMPIPAPDYDIHCEPIRGTPEEVRLAEELQHEHALRVAAEDEVRELRWVVAVLLTCKERV